MGIYVELYIDDYWNTSKENHPIYRSIQKTIDIYRWKQID
jgi:hypothetical protein